MDVARTTLSYLQQESEANMQQREHVIDTSNGREAVSREGCHTTYWFGQHAAYKRLTTETESEAFLHTQITCGMETDRHSLDGRQYTLLFSMVQKTRNCVQQWGCRRHDRGVRTWKTCMTWGSAGSLPPKKVFVLSMDICLQDILVIDPCQAILCPIEASACCSPCICDRL